MREILAKLFFCDEDSVNNVLIHIPVGVINVVIASWSGWVALIFGYGFIKYELNEQRSLGDKAYQDIKGWLWGLGITAILWGLLT